MDHYLGFPMEDSTAGGGFVHHAEDRKLYVGHVTYLDYANLTLSPLPNSSALAAAPSAAPLLEGPRGRYGARSFAAAVGMVPDLVFAVRPIGCSAGSGERAAAQGHPQRDSSRALAQPMLLARRLPKAASTMRSMILIVISLIPVSRRSCAVCAM
ncbi:MAG: hypothetical protein U5N53_09550 [Mycobacterium sp.]|nr:hypothetical protein [Mycobacterium sp.]